jgi:hypothetical protein
MENQRFDGSNKRFDALYRGLDDHGARYDVGSSAIMEKKLTAVLSKVQETIYSEAIAQNVVPMAAPEGTGLVGIEYYTSDVTGEMALIGPGSDDLPSVNEHLTKDTLPVGNYGGSFNYHLIEFERAMRQGMGFDQRRAMGARSIAERKVDSIIFSEGETNKPGIKGFFGHTLNGTASLTGGWSTATEVQILDDLKLIWQESYNGTGGEIEPDSFVLPASLYGLLKSTFRTNTDKTLLKLFAEELGVTFYRSARLNSVTSATNSISAAPVALAFKKDPMVLEMHMPRPFQLRPGQWQGLNYVTNFLLDFSGLAIYLPSSVAFGDLS